MNGSMRCACTTDDFDMGITLGTGTFGRVRLGRHKASGKHIAIKILKKYDLVRLKQVKHVTAERDVLSSVNHPFIIKLFQTFHDPKYIYMVFEFIRGGELFSLLRSARKLKSPVARFYCASVFVAFEHLHSKSIAYRDLKPENILIDDAGYIKVVDFGFAKEIEFVTYTLCGTPEYMAPEIITNRGHGKGVDWWALGILIYEAIHGQPPFCGDTAMQTYELILKGKLIFPRNFSSSYAKSLVKKLLVRDLTKRLGCRKGGPDDIKTSKWFKSFKWTHLVERRMKPPWKPKVGDDADTTYYGRYSEPTKEQRLNVRALEPKDDPFGDFDRCVVGIAA